MYPAILCSLRKKLWPVLASLVLVAGVVFLHAGNTIAYDEAPNPGPEPEEQWLTTNTSQVKARNCGCDDLSRNQNCKELCLRFRNGTTYGTGDFACFEGNTYKHPC